MIIRLGCVRRWVCFCWWLRLRPTASLSIHRLPSTYKLSHFESGYQWTTQNGPPSADLSLSIWNQDSAKYSNNAVASRPLWMEIAASLSTGSQCASCSIFSYSAKGFLGGTCWGREYDFVGNWRLRRWVSWGVVVLWLVICKTKWIRRPSYTKGCLWLHTCDSVSLAGWPRLWAERQSWGCIQSGSS